MGADRQRRRPFRDPGLVDLARQRGRTPDQIVLRWHLQLGLIPIPKTSKRPRLAENLDVFGSTLTDDEMRRLSSIQHRHGVDSGQFGL